MEWGVEGEDLTCVCDFAVLTLVARARFALAFDLSTSVARYWDSLFERG